MVDGPFHQTYRAFFNASPTLTRTQARPPKRPDLDPLVSSSAHFETTSRMLAHVQDSIPMVKEEMVEVSDPDQDEDFDTKCHIELGNYNGPDCKALKKEIETIFIKSETLDPHEDSGPVAGTSACDGASSHGSVSDDKDPLKPEPTEESDSDQDDDFDVNCAVDLGRYEVPGMKAEDDTFPKEETMEASGSSTAASCNEQDGKIIQGQGGDHLDGCCRVQSKNRELLATAIDSRKTYLCDNCPFKTTINSSMRRHTFNHTDYKPYKCTLCTYKTAYSSTVTRHMDTHTASDKTGQGRKRDEIDPQILVTVVDNRKTYSCNMCMYKTTTNSYMKRHMYTHTDDKPYKCAVCVYKSARSHDMKRHVKTHTASNKSWKSRQKVRKGEVPQPLVTQVGGHKNFCCQICLYKTARGHDMKRHMYTHTVNNKNGQFLASVINGRKSYCCQTCLYKTTRSLDMRKHITTHAAKIRRVREMEYPNIRVTVDDGRKTYRCQLCSYKTIQLYCMRKHVLVHTATELYKCVQCSYSSSRRDDLIRHITIHSERKPFKCSVCSFSSKWSEALKKHGYTHTENKPLSCAHCAFKTAFRGDLVDHLRLHSNDKPFLCSFCGYSCVQKQNLKSHVMRRHNGQRPYGCAHCAFRAVGKSELIRHLLLQH